MRDVIPTKGTWYRARDLLGYLVGLYWLPHRFCRWFGHFMVALGFIGAFLPVLPTVPFWIVAAALYKRSAPNLYWKMRTHPHIGPLLRNWEDHRVIPIPAKAIAVTMIMLSAVYIGSSSPNLFVRVVAILVAGMLCGYILIHPSRPKS